MKHVLFIQNGETETAGLYGAALEARGMKLETVHAWRGDDVPVSADDWNGIAIGGGAMSAYDTERFPFLKDEVSLLQDARARRLPVLGMCLGAQLMAAAYGGEVFPNHAKEIGVLDVNFTEAAGSDPLWQGHTQPLPVVHWHGDTFSLPQGAVLLASSEMTPNQLFRLDDSLYGFQFHLEIGRTLLAEMAWDDAEGLRHYGVDPGKFIHDAELRLPETERIAEIIFGRWAKLMT